VVTRESVENWPIFQGVQVAGISVLTVAIRRDPAEAMAPTAAAASAVLAVGLQRVLSGREMCSLVAVGKPSSRSTRVAAYHAERDKLWGALEKAGLKLPPGERFESEVTGDGDDRIRFAGMIRFAIEELPAALEITRTSTAVCIVNDRSDGVTPSHLPDFVNADTADSAVLLKSAVADLGNYFVCRATGAFDDATVTAEAFATEPLASALATELIQVRSETD